MKISIVINARFLTQKLTGVQRYAIEISKRLKKLNPNIVFVSPRDILHMDIAKELDVQIIGNKVGYFWEQIELPLYLKSIGAPLLFSPANMAPIFYKNKIVSIHDIAFVKYPYGFDWQFRLVYRLLIPIILMTSKKIITISQFSKKEMIEYYSLSAEKIVVIYNGIDEKFSHHLGTEDREKYLLGVSSLDPRKNFQGLIEAFLKLNHPSLSLYIIGGKSSNFKDIDMTIDSKIRFLGRVADEELVSYYSRALAFVYPSFYEGFGFPPLEAMACGTPVICSDSSSLPEVGGDAVVYCNPYDVEDIKEKITLLLDDEDLQEKMIKKGLERAKMFSWDKSAEQHLEIFKKVVR